MRRFSLRPLAVIGLALAPAGCDLFAPEACTMDARLGIVVEIRDATTDAYIADQATAMVVEGSFRDSLRLVGRVRVGEDFVGTTKGGIHERAGTYAVEVTAPGYSPWERTGVRVRRDECHVRTASLVARLQPTVR
jgi:hypothetical protein